MKKMMNLEGDLLEFIQICNKYELRYLVVGGYAVSIHGYPRTTKDMDVCIELSEENASLMVKVIDEFGLGTLKLEKSDFLKKDFITQLGYPPIRIDIINDMDGVSFGDAWDNRKIVLMFGVPVNFIGYHELIKMKEKAGRPQDLADVSKLKKRKQS